VSINTPTLRNIGNNLNLLIRNHVFILLGLEGFIPFGNLLINPSASDLFQWHVPMPYKGIIALHHPLDYSITSSWLSISHRSMSSVKQLNQQIHCRAWDSNPCRLNGSLMLYPFGHQCINHVIALFSHWGIIIVWNQNLFSKNIKPHRWMTNIHTS